MSRKPAPDGPCRHRGADAARHIAATVRGARLLMFPTGGHIWVGHDAELFGAVDLFLHGL